MTAVYIFKAYIKASVIGRDTKHCCIIYVNYCGFPVRLVRVSLYYRSPKSNRVWLHVRPSCSVKNHYNLLVNCVKSCMWYLRLSLYLCAYVKFLLSCIVEADANQVEVLGVLIFCFPSLCFAQFVHHGLAI